MPATLTYPGVYIEEISSGVRTIIGVSTSTTGFIGRAKKGPVDIPVVISSFGDFERIFGGLWEKSTMSFAVYHYFLNGGMEGVVVRVVRGIPSRATFASFTFGSLVLQASNPGAWANNLQITIDYNTQDPTDHKLFNLIIDDPAPPNGSGSGVTEMHRNLSVDPTSPYFMEKVLKQKSQFVRLKGSVPSTRPIAGGPNVMTKSVDGDDIRNEDILGTESLKTGLYALENADIFNLLCLPPPTFDEDVSVATYSKAAMYCEKRRAMLLVDPSVSVTDPNSVISYLYALKLPSKNAAIFYPCLRMANPLKKNLVEDFVPCGSVAGTFARTDTQRGVWKAPAGLDATLVGVSELTYTLTDQENGQLNKLGINCLRTFKAIGNIIWGARTLRGADNLTDEYKYTPVRRLALFIEETLYRNTKWIVFEPNDRPLWAQIRLNIGAFMQSLFRQGAFQGQTPKEAYFVKCDNETTTQDDINQGKVNILVGFAPLKPAEFVIIKIQQIAGQIQT